MRHTSILSRSTFLTFLAAVAMPCEGRAQVVSPADRATLEGSTSTTYPLGRFDCRLQQLHGDVPAVMLRGHAYRRDAATVAGTVTAYKTDLEVRASVSPRTPATASRMFTDNEGPPAAVLPRMWVSFPATDRPPIDPAPTFDLVIPYATPYAFPGKGATLCLDITVYGNDRGTSQNVNFTPYIDSHEYFSSGLTTQPGFRYGTGCAAQGSSSAAYASFDLRHLGPKMELDIAARNGVPTDAAGPAVSVLLLGLKAAASPWPPQPKCTLWTTLDMVLLLAGADDAKGSWDGRLLDIAPAMPFFSLYAQIASVHAVSGAMALSDGSRITIPPPAPTTIPVARIVSGSDHLAPTGTVSLQAGVTKIF